MKNSFLILISLLAISILSYGQHTELKRTPYKLMVVVDKNSVYEQQIEGTPYVLADKSIQLYLGETVYIEVEAAKGAIKSMKAVKEMKNPAITVVVSLTQSLKNKVHASTMLQVTNPFSQQLMYTATTFLLEQGKWEEAKVVPVKAGLSTSETWPDIITSISLRNLAFQSK